LLLIAELFNVEINHKYLNTNIKYHPKLTEPEKVIYFGSNRSHFWFIKSLSKTGNSSVQQKYKKGNPNEKHSHKTNFSKVQQKYKKGNPNEKHSHKTKFSKTITTTQSYYYQEC
jgi:hypothetical protein